MVDAAYREIKYRDFKLQEVRLFGKAPGPSGAPDVDQQFTLTEPVFQFSSRYENDIACVVAPVVRWFGSGSVAASIPYDLVATGADFNNSLNVCDFVAYPGFPPWYDRKGGRPILRTGTLASDPRYDYSWDDNYQGECLAFEAFSFGGSSGSPVFAVQKGPEPTPPLKFSGFRRLLMIGINSGHLPTAKQGHSGISYLYKSTVILELIG